MKKVILFLQFICTFVSFSQADPWESAFVTGIEVNGGFGYAPANDWDIAVDNFGLHFIGLYDLDGWDGKGTLKYALIDNNGNKIDGNNNLGENGQNVTASAICSYKGKIYIVLASQIQTKIKIYEKNNEHPINTNWVFKDQYDAGNSGTLYNNPKTIDICADEFGLHVVYGFNDGSGSGNIYYLNYKINESRWANFTGGPRVKINNTGTGSRRAKLTTSFKNNIERVHIVHGYDGVRTRDILFNSYDNITLNDEQHTGYWGVGRYNDQYQQYERMNFIADPRPNGKVYVINSPAYTTNLIYVDSRVKSREVESQSWTNNAGILNEYDFINEYFPQSAFYDAYINNALPVCYGYVRGSGIQQRSVIEYKVFNTSDQQFDETSRKILFDQALSNGAPYGPCIMKADSQAVYVAAIRGSNPQVIEMKRKPRDYRNDIKYNALWTGNIYINAPTNPFCRTAGADIEAKSGSVIRLREGTNVFVDPNDYIRFKQGSCVIFEPDAEIFEAGGNVYYETNCITWSNPTCNSVYNGGTMHIGANLGEFVVNNGGFLVINASSTLEVGANTKLVFDGGLSRLKVKLNSTVKLGLGASIEFRNGAYIDANGCTFTSINSGEISTGVKLIGAGSNSVIQNCTFNDANIAIDVQNTACTLLNNTINIPTAELGAVGINTSNVTSITIQHNTINIGSNASATGINMLNYDGDGLAGGIGVPTYALNVINNFINGGSYPLSISCLTANRLPFLIKGNVITPLTGITNYGIFAYNISGNIKNNIFSNNQAANSLALQQSDVNLFDNSFLSGGSTTMLLQSGTIARMAPIQDENGQWLWIGGNNSFNSNSSNNIGFTLGSNPIVSPFGSNCFYLGTMPNYFITGEFCGGRSYNVYENYWEPTPSSGTYNILCSGIPQYVNYTPYYTECPMIIGGTSTGYVVEDAGNGIYDTVYTSPGEGGEGGSESSVSKKSTISEGRLYYEALTKRKQHDYAGAIGKCKDIINSSDTSDYCISALSELYLNYQQSDTIDNQNITSGLFNNLKTYLEQKMAQYANNPVFVEKAYKFVLMCLVKSKNYTEALAGYENIMNNHPDPITRLNASWDRSAVVLLMGQGGSASSNFKKGSLNRLLDYKPSHRIAKDVFKSAKENGLAGNERSSQRKYTQEEKSELNNRIEKYNPISNKDLKEKLLSDIRLVNTINSVNRSAEENNTLSPRRFTLYQNYPNPFNPSTMIKYDIPKDAVVKVKVYDILGKQVFGLDEFKKAGSYEVRFDGANLASGMYFYSIEANGFKETKKMVLLK